MPQSQNEKLVVEGGFRLSGRIKIDSAKNAVLPLLAACLVHDGRITLCDCTPISDVLNMTEIMSHLGCKIEAKDGQISVDTKNAFEGTVPTDLSSEIRSSIFLLGPMLSRFRRAKVFLPGGCDIGLRPIDLHLKGLTALNVKIREDKDGIFCDGSEMRNGIVHLDFPSVGATENIMMAAVKLPGRTQILNAAKEPEVVDLQNFLNTLGANITGANSGVITITGVDSLRDASYTPIRDRIIAGTYLLAGAISGSGITVESSPLHLTALLISLRDAGFDISAEENSITILPSENPKACEKIETLPYPGFATDLQAQLTALQCVSDGTCVLTENLFETRFKHVPELVKMGADITVRGRTAVIRGRKRLSGTTVTAKDLRGGASLVLAGLNAKGTTIIENISVIDRGYYKIEEQLSGLGARIIRENN
jgi:UDP-N-acetylglucosamine 1-carboxyvinyltransferase